jgi:uncharacterized membrane protein YdjX (TVP38/TMEM64 family)
MNIRTSTIRILALSIFLLGILGLVAIWRWTPLANWVSVTQLTDWAQMIEDHPLATIWVLAAYMLAAILQIPLTFLLFASAAVFVPYAAFLYAMTGCLLNAAVGYAIGSRLGKAPLRKLAGKHLRFLSERLSEQGLLSVAVVRNLPVAPFSVVNIVAGASHISLKDFLCGTALGMLPGIVFITLFANRLKLLIMNPGWTNVSIAASWALLLIGLAWWNQRRLARNRTHDKDQSG